MTRWTEEEVETVLEKAIELYLTDRDTIWAFISKAQAILPHNRQREINGRANVNSKTIDLFCEKRQEVLTQGIPFEVPIEVLVTKEVQVERPIRDVLKETSTQELLIALAERMGPIIDSLPILIRKDRKNKIESVSAQTDTGQQIFSTVTPSHKTRVFMYGFLEGQKNDIIEKAKGFNLDLIFRNKDRKIFDPPTSCNYCLVIKKVSHPAWEAMKKKFEKGHIHIVNGIDSALKELANINALAGMGV